MASGRREALQERPERDVPCIPPVTSPADLREARAPAVRADVPVTDSGPAAPLVLYRLQAMRPAHSVPGRMLVADANSIQRPKKAR